MLCARDETELERAQTDLGDDVMIVPCDVTNKQSVTEMIERVDSQFGE